MIREAKAAPRFPVGKPRVCGDDPLGDITRIDWAR